MDRIIYSQTFDIQIDFFDHQIPNRIATKMYPFTSKMYQFTSKMYPFTSKMYQFKSKMYQFTSKNVNQTLLATFEI